MPLYRRLLLLSSTSVLALGADVFTKAEPHPLVVDHYSHTPAIALIAVSVFLCALGMWHSDMLAIGAGLMFGGLCGNGGELLLKGYATDWIPIDGWLTNVADITGAVGLIWCFAGYVLELRLRTTDQLAT